MGSSDDYGFSSSDLEPDDDDDICSDTHHGGVEVLDPWENNPTYQKKNYVILKEKDIRQRQEEDIAKVSTVLSVSREAAIILLRCYNWSVNYVHEEWFADEHKVRKIVGLLEKPVFVFSADAEKVTCGICFEDYPFHQIESVRAADCGHPFCNDCWKGYISTAISNGPGCLALRCPEPSCVAAVGLHMIGIFATEEDKRKYDNYLFVSYVDNNKSIKWCPGPGCDSAVEFVGSDNFDVTCQCSHRFCWNCTEEVHSPVECDTVAKWITKNNNEAENTTWIFVNTKPCPKCRSPIEKNHGCMHMTCRPPCGFEFCWLCLGSWSQHCFASCNRYTEIIREKDETDKWRERAKKSLERYAHYYERWASNHKSRLKALEDLKQMQEVNLEKLSHLQSQTAGQLKFITEAWKQIVECRRVLKWTYAYGYYLPEEELAKNEFFEYLQSEAETRLEGLHHCAEKELQKYLIADDSSKDFNDFRTKLVSLTSVTQHYFENLVRALEGGLSDVDSQGSSSRTTAGEEHGQGQPNQQHTASSNKRSRRA